MKAREARKSVMVPVRIRKDSQWGDARIRNVSSRGMMLQLDPPPPKGSFLEIRRLDIVIIGQVRWADGNCCGIRTQDKVPVEALTASAPASGSPRPDAAAFVERRAQVRVMTPEEVAERSRLRSMLFQRVSMAAAGLLGAVFVVSLMYDVFSAPFAAISNTLK